MQLLQLQTAQDSRDPIGGRELLIASLAFTGMILLVSVGLFGAYALGFFDGVKEGERIRGHPLSRRM